MVRNVCVRAPPRSMTWHTYVRTSRRVTGKGRGWAAKQTEQSSVLVLWSCGRAVFRGILIFCSTSRSVCLLKLLCVFLLAKDTLFNILRHSSAQHGGLRVGDWTRLGEYGIRYSEASLRKRNSGAFLLWVAWCNLVVSVKTLSRFGVFCWECSSI